MIAPDFLEALVCVKCRQRLVYFPYGEAAPDARDEAQGFLLCRGCALRYRVDGVPVMLLEEAEELAGREVERLVGRARALGLEVPGIP
jgi:uncharacterized protein YbaR (Trm112 family)